MGMVNFGLDVLILVVLLAGASIEIPPVLQILGRAHPMVLHFPIVFIFLLPFIPLLLTALSVNQEDRKIFVSRYFQAAHFLCGITVLFGLFLSAETGYNGFEISLHKWGGVILLVVLILLENLWYYRTHQTGTLRLMMYLPLILVVITSHIGAGVTHGQDFLTEPVRSKTTPQVPLTQALIYRDVIHPILEQKCMNCHNSSKSKGDLILADSISILKGGEDGPVITIGNPDDSPLFQRLMLDIDHDDHMPPKGKPQLTQTEINLIGQWISQEHPFDVAYAALDPADTLAVLTKTHYKSDAPMVYDMKPASKSDIRSLNDDYRLLSPIARESPALYARFLSASHYQDEYLNALTRVKDQVVDLYLGHMPVDDEDLSIVGQFSNLQVLNLNGTRISDQGLTNLYELTDLQKLYLTGTDVSESGISNLLKANPIKKLYLWASDIDSSGMKSLRIDFPNTEITGETNPFGNEVIALNAPQIKPESPFFHSSVRVTFDHPIPQVTLRYTTDGSLPDSMTSPIYTEPLELTDDTEFQIQAFKPGWLSSPVVTASFYGRKYSPDSSWLETVPKPNFSGNGAITLTDQKAGDKVHEDKSYLGYRNNEAIFGFRFDHPSPLESIVISCLVKTPAYIFPPLRVRVEVMDEAGSWQEAGSSNPEQPTARIDYAKEYLSIPLDADIQVRQIRLTLTPQPVLPSWHRGKGEPAWVFVDEVLFQ